MEVELYFRFRILWDFYRSGLYPAGSSLSIAGIVCIAAPAINASGLWSLYSPLASSSLSSRPVRLFSDWLFSSISKSHSSLEIDLTLHQGNQIEMYLSIGHCFHLVQTYWLVNVLL